MNEKRWILLTSGAARRIMFIIKHSGSKRYEKGAMWTCFIPQIFPNLPESPD